VMRDSLLRGLGRTKAGETIRRLAESQGLGTAPEDLAVFDAFLLLSPECRKERDRWLARGTSRASRILAEVRSYADASGKRIFRLSSALRSIEAHEHPTGEELEQIFRDGGEEFKLLPNAMVKRVSR
jgi:hypothetical protein